MSLETKFGKPKPPITGSIRLILSIRMGSAENQ